MPDLIRSIGLVDWLAGLRCPWQQRRRERARRALDAIYRARLRKDLFDDANQTKPPDWRTDDRARRYLEASEQA